MRLSQTKISEALILSAVAVIAFLFWVYIKSQDTSVCRDIFSGLVKGSYTVHNVIDWDNLKALGLDVGASYRQLNNPQEKANYQRAFINNFALGFKRSGGKSGAFINWRLYDKDDKKIVVASDYQDYNKTILFTLTNSVKKKLVDIQWEALSDASFKQ